MKAGIIRGAHRAFDHRTIKDRCNAIVRESPRTFSDQIVNVAAAVVNLQRGRNRAFCDPTAIYVQSAAPEQISIAERALVEVASAKRSERKRFAVWLLLKLRDAR